MVGLLVAATILAGCNEDGSNDPVTIHLVGSTQMRLKMEIAPGLGIDSGTVTISKGELEYSQQLVFEDNVASVLFEDLQPGLWMIDVELMDEDGYVLYTGGGEAEVISGQTSTATIVMEELTGGLEVIIELPSNSIEPTDFSPDAITIDFDDLMLGPLTDQLAHLGVIFQNTEVITREYAPSSPNEIAAVDADAPIRAVFVDPLTMEPTMTIRVGMFIDLDGMHPPVSVVAYDENGDLIESVPFDAPGDFAGVEYLDGIASVEMGPQDGYDDFMFEPVVPPDEDCWDYGNVDAPVIGCADTPGTARAVVVTGNYAYVADGAPGGLQILDITVPASPQLIGSAVVPWGSQSIVVQDYYAYVTGYEFMSVIDVADPTMPQIVGSVRTCGAAGVAISGNYAYVSGGGNCGDLVVVDIADPTNPQVVGSADLPGEVRDVKISGNYLYVVDGPPGGLQIFDISDSGSLQLVGSIVVPFGAHSVALDGAYAYVTDGADLQVVDIADPADPQIIGSVEACGEKVVIAGSYAYLPGDLCGQLVVIDITDPANPEAIGSMQLPGYALEAAVDPQFVYLASGSAGMCIVWQQCE